mgnify:CR=1 FL=1
MNKIVKYILIGILVLGALWAAAFFIKSNSKDAITYETEQPFKTDIEKKTVATGKVVPEDEVEIKPQISGIIQKIYMEEGQKVKSGELIATIKVVPNEQALNQSRGRVRNAELALNNVQIEYNRNKSLFDKGVISSQDFNTLQLQYDQAKQELDNSKADYQIIRQGSAGGSTSANTNIRATVDGTILEIPVEEGDQVIESNNFNDGTTIATIADLSKMIFEGKVDEGEVAKLEVGTPLKISLGAVEGAELDAKLRFIAPKGIEETGAVQFKIEGEVFLDDSHFIRAGYSYAFETPTLNELSARPDGQGGLNEDLNPQQSNTYEVGYKGRLNDSWKMDITFFSISSKDELLPYELSEFPGRTFYRNAGRTLRQGIEWQLKAELMEGIRLESSYTFSDFRFTEFDLSTDKLLPGIPRHNFGLMINYEKSDWNFSFQYNYLSSLFADSANETEVKPYHLASVFINRKIGAFRPFININNIFNSQYFDNIRINAFGGRFYEPAPPRNFNLGVKFEF